MDLAAFQLNASGGSQPRNDEGASHFARRGKNVEAFLIENIRKQNCLNT